MNIQIFGKYKCFDTKKAQRYFKERRVKFQAIDLNKYGISKGELTSVLRSVKLPDLIDDKLLEDPTLLRTPIVRNGKQATVGYQPDIWKGWE